MVTVEQLDELMNKYFLSFQLKKIGWNDLEGTDKEVIISLVDDEFNRIQFIGDKLDDNQVTAFPRIYNGIELGVDLVERAISQFAYDYMRVNTDESMQRIMQGITSIKIADASESYSSSQTDIYKELKTYKKYLSNLIYRG